MLQRCSDYFASGLKWIYMCQSVMSGQELLRGFWTVAQTFMGASKRLEMYPEYDFIYNISVILYN